MRGRSLDAEIHWEGNSLEVLSRFPSGVKQDLGYNLRRLQQGKAPLCASRPMQSIGKGVFELKEQDERTWYRVIYLARIRNVIYVLHCFEKDTRKTEARHIETAKARLKDVHRSLRETKSEGE